MTKFKNQFDLHTITLKGLDTIETKPNKEKKSIKGCGFNFGILYERRNPKVETDENKLFGTKKNHKYF